jgi:pSer/pThr/pTyr-binding forkhead associated (FHA) protein
MHNKLPMLRGPVPALVPVGKYAGSPAISLKRPITLVGGAENAHVKLASRSVDPMHAMIVVSGGRVYVRDLASQGGVTVNGQGVREGELTRDDVLGVGSFEFRVSVPAEMEGGREESGPGGTFSLDGNAVELGGRVLLMGRRSGCDLVLTDPQASRVHAAVVAVDGQLVVRDLGSRAGTLVNSDKVHEQVIEHGDEIHIASHAIFYQGAAAAAAGGDAVAFEDSMFSEAVEGLEAAAGPEEEPLALDLPKVEEADPLALDLSGVGEAPAVAAEAGAEEEGAMVPLDVSGVEDAAAGNELDAEEVEGEAAIPVDVAAEDRDDEGTIPVAGGDGETDPELEASDASEEAAEDVAVPVEEGMADGADDAASVDAGEMVIGVSGDATVPEAGDAERDEDADAALPLALEEGVGEDVPRPDDAAGSEGEVAPREPVSEEVLPVDGEGIGEPEEGSASNAGEVGMTEGELEELLGTPGGAGAGGAEPLALAEDVTGDEAAAVDQAAGEVVAEDDLAGTPFSAVGEEVTVGDNAGGGDEAEQVGAVAEIHSEGPEPAPEAAPAGGSFVGTVGANQAMYLTGSPVAWRDIASLGASIGGGIGAPEVSLSGVHGVVEGVERVEEPVADAPARGEEPAALVEGPEELAAPEGAARDAEVREQLLGFIKIGPGDAVTTGTAEPIETREAVEPAESLVEAGEGDDEVTAVDLPLVEDKRPGEDAGRSKAGEPGGLHAVKPPPAARGFVRGLSSLTGGGRVVDVFSQLPLVSDDPVLGQVAGPAELESVEDPGMGVSPPVMAEGKELGEAVRPMPGVEGRREDDGGKGSPPLVRKLKRMFGDRGRQLGIAGVMAGAAALAYALAPARSVVRGEIAYRNLSEVPAGAARAAVMDRQRALLTDPGVLEAARAEVVAQGWEAGWLADPLEASLRVERGAAWSGGTGGTGAGNVMAISFESREPAEDAERLRALVRAVAKSRVNREGAAAGERAAARAEQVRADVAELDRNLAALERQAAEGARLAGEKAGGGEVENGEVGREERAWREASLAALRAQAEVEDLRRRKVPADDPRVTGASARLTAAREEETRALRAFEAAPAGGGGGTAAVSPERRAAEAAASARVLRGRRAERAAELDRLEAEARLAVVPVIGKDGGVWVNSGGDNRGLYAVGAAVVGGVGASYLWGGKARNPKHEIRNKS